jgi:hypothetical protein
MMVVSEAVFSFCTATKTGASGHPARIFCIAN